MSLCKSRSLALTALLACCLPSPVFGDEFQYLPDNAQTIVSIDLTTAAKSRTYQEFWKALPELQADPLAKELSKFARITTATYAKEAGRNEIVVMTALKPIAAVEVKALNRPSPFRKNFAFKEIKHGSFTLYQETYQLPFKDGDLDPVPVEGMAFCIMAEKYVVKGQLAALKQILDRGKPAVLSATMQAGLKEAGLSNGVCVVVDVQNLPARARENLLGFKKLSTAADIKANLAKVQALTVTMNEPGRAKLNVTLRCSEPAVIKSLIDRSLAEVKAKLNDPALPSPPPEFKKMFADLNAAFKDVQVTALAEGVRVAMEMEPLGAVFAVTFWMLTPYDTYLDLEMPALDPPSKK